MSPRPTFRSTDLRHFVDEAGMPVPLPEEARELVESARAIASAGWTAAPGEAIATVVRCPERPRGYRCFGRLDVRRREDPPQVEWTCEGCGATGVVFGWEGTAWDPGPLEVAAAPDGVEGEDPEELRLTLWECDVLLGGLGLSRRDRTVVYRLRRRDDEAVGSLSGAEHHAFLMAILGVAGAEKSPTWKEAAARIVQRSLLDSGLPPGPESPEETAPEHLIDLRMSLRGMRPAVWRRVRIPAECTLAELHVVIQRAFRWTSGFEHRFRVGSRTYGAPSASGPRPDSDSEHVTLRDVVRVGDPPFEYRSGGDREGWSVDLDVDAIHADPGKGELPVCIAGAGAAPPQDCGGAAAFERAWHALHDERHPDHERAREEWGTFDPQRFDPEAVNRAFRPAGAPVNDEPAEKLTGAAARAEIRRLFDEPPRGALLSVRFEDIHRGAARFGLLEALEREWVHCGQEPMFVEALSHVGVTDRTLRKLRTLVASDAVPIRMRALADHLLLVHAPTDGGPPRPPLQPEVEDALALAWRAALVRAVERSPEDARRVSESLRALAPDDAVALLERLDDLRHERDLEASVLYGPALRETAEPAVARWIAARVIGEEGAGGREQVEDAAAGTAHAAVRDALEDVLAAAPPASDRDVGSALTWVSACNGEGTFRIVASLGRRTRRPCVVSLTATVTGEVRDGLDAEVTERRKLAPIVDELRRGWDFARVPRRFAAALAVRAREQALARGQRVPERGAAALARLESLAPPELPSLPAPCDPPTEIELRAELDALEYESWLLRQAELEELGRASSGAATRLVAMAEFMARWCDVTGDPRRARIHAAIARSLRDAPPDRLDAVPFVRFLAWKAGPDAPGMRRIGYGDLALRERLRSWLFPGAGVPTGRHVARLDLGEVVFGVLADIAADVPADARPADDVVAGLAGDAVDVLLDADARGVTAADGLDALLRRAGGPWLDERFRPVDSILHVVESFVGDACRGCKVRCLDRLGDPMPVPFLADEHPSVLPAEAVEVPSARPPDQPRRERARRRRKEARKSRRRNRRRR